MSMLEGNGEAQDLARPTRRVKPTPLADIEQYCKWPVEGPIEANPMTVELAMLTFGILPFSEIETVWAEIVGLAEYDLAELTQLD